MTDEARKCYIWEMLGQGKMKSGRNFIGNEARKN